MDLNNIIDISDDNDDNLSNATTVIMEDFDGGNFEDIPTDIPDDLSLSNLIDPTLDLDNLLPSLLSNEEESVRNEPIENKISNHNDRKKISDSSRRFQILSLESLSEQVDAWLEDERNLISGYNESNNLNDENASKEQSTSISTGGNSSVCNETLVSKSEKLDENASTPVENHINLNCSLDTSNDYPLLVPHHKIPISDDRDFPNVSYNCKNCRKIFHSSNTLKNHTVYCSKGKATSKCNYCDHVSPNSLALKKHMKIHSLKKKYKCSHCCYSAKLADNLIRHKKSIHKLTYRERNNKFDKKCKYCQQSFGDKNSLRIHTETHILRYDNNLLYKCNICMFKTSSKSSLIKHCPCHENPDLYICNECGKIHKCRELMKKHWHSPSGGANHGRQKIKVFQCFMCEYFCKKIDNFILHIIEAHGCQYLLHTK